LLEWTGERFIPGVKGDIEIEHLHRYHAVRDMVRGLRVLDIACGEGYGSAILAVVAQSVVGVDKSPAAVSHAQATYTAAGLRYECGSCEQIPLGDASVDVVVCFETLEHVAAHEQVLAELRRVLAPGGFLVISCPDRLEYSDVPRFHNEFHVKELYANEFRDLLCRTFKHVQMYGQRVQYASVLGPLDEPQAPFVSFRPVEQDLVRGRGILRPVYLLAVASDETCPVLPCGALEPIAPPYLAEVEALRLQAQREHTERARVEGDLGRAQGELLQAQDEMVRLQAEAGQIPTLRSAAASAEAEAARLRAQLGDLQGRSSLQEAQLAEQAQCVLEQRQQLATQEGRIATQAARLEEAVAARSADREAQQRAEWELKARLETSTQDLRQQTEQLARSRQEEAALRHGAEELRTALQAEEARARVLSQRASQLGGQVESMLASRSWRITGPLRTVMTAMRRVKPRTRLLRASEWLFITTFRNLPFSRGTRLKLRNALYRTLPWAFAHTGSYRGWRDELAAAAVTAATPPPAAATPLISAPAATAPSPTVGPRPAFATPLPAADGTWEWADSAVIRQRVASGEAAQREALRVSPVAMISLEEGDIDAVVAGLQFPECAEPLVSILIPTYGNFRYTAECLLSVARCGSTVSFEVLIADDASNDGTAARLAQVPNLRVLPAEQNQGFLRNCNRALPSARGRFIVLLNNDVQVQPGWLEALASPALADPRVGAVGPKILYPSGHLQEAGCSFRQDGTTEMVGLDDNPDRPQYAFKREVDYCSGAALLVNAAAFRALGGFDDALAPAYCEDSDLCLRLRQEGLRVVYTPEAVVVHHLSKTTAAEGNDVKLAQVGRNLEKFSRKWQGELDRRSAVRVVAFYLPQYHPIPENDRWWGTGFTEWRNVVRAQPNFVGHYQPRVPADLGYYDLRVPEIADRQAALARRYGIDAFCYYYYWFAGRRLLEMPIERLIAQGRPDLPFCLCWANENWTRRWDGQDQEILMAQAHSDADDEAVIRDLIRYLRHPNYLRVDGKPFLAVYRTSLFPDFAATAATWRRICRQEGVGELYLSMVESFDVVSKGATPARLGCDAVIEFPPHGMAEVRPPSGEVLNPRFSGFVADYRDLATRYCLREPPDYTLLRGLMPGWDNTARRQDASFAFENATPGAFEAWAEFIIDQTRRMRCGDERLVFVNAWNEWAEGAYLEPDQRYGHAFLEALKNAKEAALLKRRSRYALG
jgi:GT2 family glycosyltransferase/SAM-dependent methyltransferase